METMSMGVNMSLEYNEKNITLAKNLRKNATPQENHLWYDLRVICFINIQIDTNFRGVCEYIDAVVKASLREGGGPP